MSGRYGNDSLNNGILILAVIMDVIGMILKNSWVILAAEVLLILVIYRCFSKQIYKRQEENRIYWEKTKKFRRHWNVMVKNIKDKQFHYYVCPECGQMVRIPRHKGKIEITCPKCGKEFSRRS